MQARDITRRAASAHLKTNPQTIHLICLPFSDPQRRFPNPRLMAAIEEWTAGEVTFLDFHQPSASEAAL